MKVTIGKRLIHKDAKKEYYKPNYLTIEVNYVGNNPIKIFTAVANKLGYSDFYIEKVDGKELRSPWRYTI